MTGNSIKEIRGYQLVEPGGELQEGRYELKELRNDEILVKVAGCGLCHTDMSFIYGGVKTRAPLPLVLGHEISGTVVDAGSGCSLLAGRKVVVPAVIPCGECDLCRAGRGNICRNQLMPGNDFHGGFADYVVVPGRFVCPVDELKGFELWELAVVADAVTTPFMAMKRAGVSDGDVVICIGVGGIGSYGVQLASAFGARVIAIDVDQDKLDKISRYGADWIVNASDRETKEVQKEVRGLIKTSGLKPYGWKVFEMSGTTAGQEVAFSLLTFAGTLAVVGFTMGKVTIRLSNLMALDADCFGIWGCLPDYYPDAISMVLEGKINIRDFSEGYPLDRINEVIKMAKEHKLHNRAVLTPGI